MAKRADVELRIRSKNLAKRDLQDLNDQLAKLIEQQERQSSAAVLASRSLRDLNTEQRQLAQITNELSRRRSLVESLIGQLSQIDAAKKRLNELRAELAELRLTQSRGNFLGDIGTAIKNVEKEIVGAEKTIAATTSRVDKLRSTLGELGVNTDDAAAAISEITGSLSRAQAAFADQTRDIERYSRAQDEAAASARKLAEAQRFANEQAQRQSTRRADAVAAFSGPGFDEWQRQRVEMERVRGVNDRFAAVLARNEKAQAAFAAQTGRATRSAGEQSRAVSAASGAMSRHVNATQQATLANSIFADTGRKSLSFYQRMRGEILSLVAAYGGLFAAFSQFGQAMRVLEERQSIQAQLLRANGNNARWAAEDQRFLRAEAERLGLVYDDLAKKYANFSISARAAGLSTSATRQAFKQATEIVVGARLSAEDADGVFRAFVQIMSKAKVQAEELRGQLGDRLPGAVAAFAKANNLALSELDDFLKEGKARTQEFLRFLEAYAKQSQGAVEAGSKTLFADINRLKTAYRDFLELFASQGVSDELQKSVRALTTALKGEEGKKFATELAAAFKVLLDVLKFAIENFEELLAVVKAIVAFQLAKAVYGAGLSLRDMARSTIGTVKALRDFHAAAKAAAAAGTAMSLAQRGILALAGPVGGALAAIAAGFYAVARAAASSEERMRQFEATMRRVRGVKTTFDVDAERENVEESLRQSRERVQKLEGLRDDLGSLNPLRGLPAVFAGIEEDVFGTLDAEREITLELQKQEAFKAQLGVLERKRRLFAEKEAAEDKKRLQDEEAAARAMNAAGGEDKKGKTEKQLRAEENARANAARAIQKEILDLDQEIFDARTEGEIRTVEQIERNYELAIRKIEAQIAEKRLDLDRLEQNVRAANNGQLPAQEAGDLAAARERVYQLQLALNTRALEKADLQEVAVLEKQVNDLIAERDAKLAAINTQVELGTKTAVEGRREALRIEQQYAGQITANAQSLIALLQSLPPDLFARLGGAKLVAELEAILARTRTVKTEFQVIGENLGGQFAQGAAEAFGVLAKGIAGFLQGANSIGDAFRAAGDAFQEWLANFLVGIGQAIMQALILRAITNALGITSGWGGIIQGALGVTGAQNHTGGIVGQDGKSRWIPLAALANAQRFHDGGLPGLKRNEVPTILEKGEEVLTADDPRHVNNGGVAPAPSNTTIINTIDSPSVIEAGLPTKAGTKTLVNVIKANRGAFRTALGI